MPIFEYQCLQCGTRVEVILRLDDKAPTKCEECGGELKKLISAPAFQFKGSGWYVTDYAGKKGGAEGKDGARERGKSGASGSEGSGAAESSSAGPATSASSAESGKSGDTSAGKSSHQSTEQRGRKSTEKSSEKSGGAAPASPAPKSDHSS